MTYSVVDGSGERHWYCQDCDDIIEETTHELEGDDEWYLEDLIYLEEVEGYDVGDDLDDTDVSEWDSPPDYER